MNKIAIAIHGGAGTILKCQMTPAKEDAYVKALDKSLTSAYLILTNGGSSLDAVETAVIQMEDSPLFNAGKGSVFTTTGTHEMDAAIMDGNTLQAGSVALVSGVRNPISLARLVMEKSDHVILASNGAEEFAKANDCRFEGPDYFYDELRFQQLKNCQQVNCVQLDHSITKENKYGTVGAVALDINGNIASATSTGGMTNKKYGRIGDTPVIGAGTYANNKTCAVSCTGAGEYFLRQVAAYDVSCLIEFKKELLGAACKEVIHQRMKRIGGQGGLIAINKNGDICMEFNTEGMYRGSIDLNGLKDISIYK